MAEVIRSLDLLIVDPHHHLQGPSNYAAPASAPGGPPAHPFITAIDDAQRYLLDEHLADTGFRPMCAPRSSWSAEPCTGRTGP